MNTFSLIIDSKFPISYSKFMEKFKALLDLTRWKEYYGKVIFITLLGGYVVKAPLISIIILLIANILNGAFAFMINDIADAEDDALDKKKRLRNPISSGRLSNDTAQFATFLTAFFSLVLYLFLGWRVFAYGLSGTVIGFLYSYRKVRLKTKPVVDFSSHGYFLGLVYFLTAVNLGAQIPHLRIFIWLGVPIYLISVTGSISNQIRDYHADRKAGLENSAKFIKFKKFKKLFFYISLILVSTIFTFVILYLSNITRTILSGATMFIVIHYYLRWFRHNKAICYYPYNQQFLTFMGLLFLLNI